MITRLEHAEVRVLRALNTAGSRWHELADLVEATGFSLEILRGVLAALRRRDLVVPRTTGLRPTGWSISTLGGKALEHHDATEGAA